MTPEVDLKQVRQDEFDELQEQIDEFIVDLSQHIWEHSALNPANYDEDSVRYNKAILYHQDGKEMKLRNYDDTITYSRVTNGAYLAETAYKMAAYAIENDYASGYQTTSIAGSCVYLACLLENFKIYQIHLSSIIGVAEATISRHYQKIHDIAKETDEITFTRKIEAKERY